MKSRVCMGALRNVRFSFAHAKYQRDNRISNSDSPRLITADDKARVYPSSPSTETKWVVTGR